MMRRPQKATQNMKRRISLDLYEETAVEVDSMKDDLGYSILMVFRLGFSLLKLYRQAVREGKEMRIVDPENPATHTVIILP